MRPYALAGSRAWARITSIQRPAGMFRANALSLTRSDDGVISIGATPVVIHRPG